MYHPEVNSSFEELATGRALQAVLRIRNIGKDNFCGSGSDAYLWTNIQYNPIFKNINLLKT
jgi:hypothetical protein